MTRHPKSIKASTSIFETIPHELVSEVLGRVASSSITDMFNAKLSCKKFNEIAEDMYVYRRVSLDKFPINPWKPLSQKQLTFLNKCREYEHPELMYRQAVLDYFNRKNLRSTCMNLQKALKQGHAGALYFSCIVLLFSGEDELKKEGIKMLGNMKKTHGMKRKIGMCRENLTSILKEVWVKNPVLREPPPICCTTPDQHKRIRRSGDEEEDVACEACVADIEISFLSGRYKYQSFDY